MKNEAEITGEVEETLERLSRALKKSTAHDCPDEQPAASEGPSSVPNNSGEPKTADAEDA